MKRPIVLHIYGFDPIEELHSALARVPELSEEYEFICPSVDSPAQILLSEWTYRVLDYFILPSDWHMRPLYIIQPHSIHIGVRVWRRIIEQFVETYPKTVYQLQIESGIKRNQPERWIVTEIILHSRQAHTYL